VLKLTVKPDVAVAERLKSGSVAAFVLGGSKLIVCAFFEIVNVLVTSCAAL
jgi:hypothetical protein